MLVLLVEDDLHLATLTIDFLAAENIEVDFASTIKNAKQITKDNSYDAIVLDLELPDGSGYELAEFFTSTMPNCPILFLTAQCSLEHKLAAFQRGALDYVTKPFALAELAVRIKLLSAKNSRQTQPIFTLDSLQVDFSQRIVTRGQRHITLSPQQWQLLQLVAASSPTPVSKQTIVDVIWPDTDVNTNMYKSLLTRLRKNITQHQELELIHTIKSVGVCLREPQ